MSTIRLTKHHGLGNDFLVAFDRGAFAGSDVPELARRWCHRRRGIGADGLLLAADADGYDARMVLYNADGSRAEMSGNGIRCFAQAVAGRQAADAELVVRTDVGDRRLEITATDDPDTVDVRVEMGDIDTLPEPSGWATLGCHPDRPVAHLSVGNPHSVVGVDEVAVVDLAALGGQVPHINLEIVEPGPEPDAITMRVHERGVGITDACGTGAVASAYAARSWGLVASQHQEITVHMDGGRASVGFDVDVPTRAVLTGPATYVASIEVDLR